MKGCTIKKGFTLIEKKWTSEAIRNLRLALEMTQEEFAREIGVVVRTIIYWENPKNKHKPLKMAKKQFSRLERKVNAKTNERG